MEQGQNSLIKKKGERVYKFINQFSLGLEVDPYAECHLLKKVSKLGKEFPQKVICEGPYF